MALRSAASSSPASTAPAATPKDVTQPAGDDALPKLALKLNAYLLSLVEDTKAQSSVLTQAIGELEAEAKQPLTEDLESLDDL
jgi:hypothetical protein|eukprot:COSAG06_NODE_3109_length_5845_cov_5.988688_2_plen_83_part_00